MKAEGVALRNERSERERESMQRGHTCKRKQTQRATSLHGKSKAAAPHEERDGNDAASQTLEQERDISDLKLMKSRSRRDTEERHQWHTVSRRQRMRETLESGLNASKWKRSDGERA